MTLLAGGRTEAGAPNWPGPPDRPKHHARDVKSDRVQNHQASFFSGGQLPIVAFLSPTMLRPGFQWVKFSSSHISC
jgi:hypothetical protein